MCIEVEKNLSIPIFHLLPFDNHQFDLYIYGSVSGLFGLFIYFDFFRFHI